MQTSPALSWTLALLLVLGACTLAVSQLRDHLVRAGVGSPVAVAAVTLEPGELKPPRERHRPERARRPVQRSTRPSSYDW